MPQMSPLLWLPMLILNLMTLYLTITSIHFCASLESMSKHPSSFTTISNMKLIKEMEKSPKSLSLTTYGHKSWKYMM
nr:TPA_asm: ATP synthase F0 subunit 8 [Pseudomyrmex feralis]